MFHTGPSQGALVAITGLFLAGCLTAGPGACGTEDREFFAAVSHFEGLSPVPEDHPYGVCAAIVETDAPVDDVIEHYAAEFEAAGWRVPEPDVGHGGGEPGITRVTSVSGYRDTYQYHVAVTETDTGMVIVDLLAGNSEQ